MTTFNNLSDDILTWLNRSDAETIAQVPNFIYLAEQQICRECKNVGLTRYVVSDFSLNGGGFIAGNPNIPKPTGWRRSLSFTNNANGVINQMEIREKDFLDAYWPNGTLTGIPLYYSDYGQNYFRVAPTPAENYAFQISYLEFPTPLSALNQTNWLTDFIPDILLYSCLLNAMPYVKDDERLPAWKQEYKERVAALDTQNSRRILDRATDRSSD